MPEFRSPRRPFHRPFHRQAGAAARNLAALAAAALLCLPAVAAKAKAAPAAPLEGLVTQVVDGDTLAVQVQGGALLQVRIRDIDAPEICQPWGAEARKALSDLALNKPATLQPSGRDGTGRTVATVLVDGVNLGPRLVEDGNAFSTRTRWDRGPLVKQERMAKSLGRGVHNTPGALLPSEFRRVHGPCQAAAK